MGMGRIKICIPISDFCFLAFYVDVVEVHVPLLLCMDLMKENRLIMDISDHQVNLKTDGCSLPLAEKNVHAYFQWASKVIYTTTELRKIHPHLYQTHPGKLFAVMKRTDPDSVSPSVMEDLETISATCDVFQ